MWVRRSTVRWKQSAQSLVCLCMCGCSLCRCEARGAPSYTVPLSTAAVRLFENPVPGCSCWRCSCVWPSLLSVVLCEPLCLQMHLLSGCVGKGVSSLRSFFGSTPIPACPLPSHPIPPQAAQNAAAARGKRRGGCPCNNIDFAWEGKVQFVLNFPGKFG